MSIFHGDMGASTPFYVTRKTADGDTGSLSLSIWMQLLVIALVWLNIVVWSLVGLVVAGATVAGWFA